MTGVVDKCIRRFDILMDEALAVDLAKRHRQTNGNAQKASQIDRLSILLLDCPVQHSIQGFTTGILKEQDRSPLLTNQRKRLSCPCRIEFGRQRIFVF